MTRRIRRNVSSVAADCGRQCSVGKGKTSGKILCLDLVHVIEGAVAGKLS
jgi:hypothetical protein